MKEVGDAADQESGTLRGRMIVNLFFEAEHADPHVFEIADKRLGADTLGMTASGSSVSKGETLVDTRERSRRCGRT